MPPTQYVIIGDGAAGITAAQYLRHNDPGGQIDLVADDPNPAYFRAALTNYLIGELRDDQIWAVPPDFYSEFKITRRLDRVLDMDTANARLRLASGGNAAYDKLLIATGSRPNTLDIEGAHLPGVMTMRTLQDARQVLDWVGVRGLRRAVIVGGGPLSLEWAQGLGERGVEVTMVLRDDHMMKRELDATASDLVEARLRLHGIQLLTFDEVVAAIPGKDGHLSAVKLKSGRELPCDLFGVAIGVRCNSEFLANTPIAQAKNGAIVVDVHQRTSVENVCAAGDVAEVNGVNIQLWEPARWEGRTAAHTLTGREAATDVTSHYFATRLYDLDFALVTKTGAETDAGLTDFPLGTGRISYRKLQLSKGRLVYALLLGERKEKIRAKGRLYQRLIKEEIDVSSIRNRLLDPDFDLAAWLKAQNPVEKMAAAAGAVRSSADLRRQQAVAGSAFADAPDADVEAVPSGGKRIVSVGLSAMRFEVASARPIDQIATIESEGGRWELAALVTLIGRNPEATISLADPGVSFAHAQITRQGDRFFLRDLGSRNGTWVNNRQVSVPVALHDGDSIGVGQTNLTFRVEGSQTSYDPGADRSGPKSGDFGVREASRRLAVLQGRAGVALGLEFELAESPVTIGRDPGCDIRLNDPAVSRYHAWLTQADGRWHIADTGSANGTLVNGQALEADERRELQDGDEIEFGAVTMKFRQWRGEG